MSAVLAPTLTRRIGRFELLSELGSGAQGTVYLANDTRLEREVALKTLRLGQHDPAQHAMLVHQNSESSVESHFALQHQEFWLQW